MASKLMFRMNFRVPFLFAGLLLITMGCGTSVEIVNPVKPDEEIGIPYEPYSAKKHFEFGTVFQEEGHLKKARIEYRRTLEKDPSFHRAHLQLGRILLLEGNLEEAEAHFDSAYSIKPTAPATSNLAYCWIQQNKKLDRAVSLLLKGTVRFPTYRSSFYDSIALAFIKKGEPQVALALIRRELNREDVRSGQFPYLFYHYAMARRKRNQPWQAPFQLAVLLHHDQHLRKKMTEFLNDGSANQPPWVKTTLKEGNAKKKQQIETSQRKNIKKRWVEAALKLIIRQCLQDQSIPGTLVVNINVKSNRIGPAKEIFSNLRTHLKNHDQLNQHNPVFNHSRKNTDSYSARLDIVLTEQNRLQGRLIEQHAETEERKHRSSYIPCPSNVLR